MTEAEAILELPRTASLMRNYPNPFNNSTTIDYEIPISSAPTQSVKLTIYDILGRRVITLVDEEKRAGFYTVNWSGTNHNGRQVASGIYFYELRTPDFTDQQKMILLK